MIEHDEDHAAQRKLSRRNAPDAQKLRQRSRWGKSDSHGEQHSSHQLEGNPACQKRAGMRNNA